MLEMCNWISEASAIELQKAAMGRGRKWAREGEVYLSLFCSFPNKNGTPRLLAALIDNTYNIPILSHLLGLKAERGQVERVRLGPYWDSPQNSFWAYKLHSGKSSHRFPSYHLWLITTGKCEPNEILYGEGAWQQLLGGREIQAGTICEETRGQYVSPWGKDVQARVWEVWKAAWGRADYTSFLCIVASASPPQASIKSGNHYRNLLMDFPTPSLVGFNFE